jgi:hypothetical protein
LHEVDDQPYTVYFEMHPPPVSSRPGARAPA